jgi:putative zinc finger/helix-turn-helix YgiT family protein
LKEGIKMKKFYCSKCKKLVEYVSSVELKKYDYKDISLEINENIKRCKNCNEELFDEEETKKTLDLVYSKFLEQYNITFDTFKSIREKLGLSTDAFAKLMNWSKKTVIRYENKQSIPQGEYLNKYIELNNNPNKIIECLKIRKEYLEENDYNKILKVLEKSGYYSTNKEKLSNLFLYFLSEKKLYTTQLVKYLFATDFLYYKKYGKSITGYNYVKLEHGPVLDHYKDIINNLIKEELIEITETEVYEENGELKDTFKFGALCRYNRNLFSKEEMDIMEDVSNRFKNYSSKKLSEWSHKFIGWQKTPNYKVISYDYAEHLEI